MAENDYSRKQREHAARIATERGIMDQLGVTRSQARRINNGMTELMRAVAAPNAAQQQAGAAPEFLGPPVPPNFKPPPMATVTSTKTGSGRTGEIGRPRNAAAPAPPSNVASSLGVLVLQAYTVDGTTVTAEAVQVVGQVLP